MSLEVTFAPARGAADRLVCVQAPRPGSTTVFDMPAGGATRALHKLTRVVFYPVPDRISYADLMAYRDGQLVTNRK